MKAATFSARDLSKGTLPLTTETDVFSLRRTPSVGRGLDSQPMMRLHASMSVLQRSRRVEFAVPSFATVRWCNGW